jgi:transcriptional regulator with XRE-family HTH domain
MGIGGNTMKNLVGNFVDIDRKRTARAGVLSTKLSCRILSLCEEHGLSQRQLAIQAGLDPVYISRIIRESGLVTMEALAHVFGLTLSEFFEGVTRTQDWKPITDEQLKAINAKLALIVGEPTDEQLDAIVRSVMTPSS